MRQKSLLIYLIVVVKLENQRQFDEIYEYCQLIFDEKLRLLTKLNLYCQTKVTMKYSLPVIIILDESSRIAQTCSPNKGFSCQSMCAADMLCSRSYLHHFLLLFFLLSWRARFILSRYLWILLWDILWWYMLRIIISR